MFEKLPRFLSPLRLMLVRSASAAPVQRSRSLLLLRLENAETLGEYLGKAAMGHLVVRLSMTLSRAIRPDDPVEIIAPGLFAVTLNERDELDAIGVGRRLLEQAQTPIAVAGRDILPVLTGVLVHAEGASLPDLADMTENARQRFEGLADDALGRVTLFPYDPALTRGGQGASVAEAAAAGEIQAYFQPQVCCNTGAVRGFELLARWNHPQRGLLLPGAFFGRMSAEDHGALTLAILDQGLRALKTWDRAGWDVPRVALNISNCELANPDFAAGILWELDRHDLRPERLTIEVLETVGPITSNAEARRNLLALARAGCNIDLDDFGTGYASLDAIRQFGVQRIKIDRSFVTGCDIDPGQQRMILAILALAERLGIAALAEGVETREEYTFLAQMGCDEVQGHAIARPMPLEDVASYLARHAESGRTIGRLLG